MSIEEVIARVAAIQLEAERLSRSSIGAKERLDKNTNQIAGLVRGSHTGGVAVASLRQASDALKNASASMKLLGVTCLEYQGVMRK